MRALGAGVGHHPLVINSHGEGVSQLPKSHYNWNQI